MRVSRESSGDLVQTAFTIQIDLQLSLRMIIAVVIVEVVVAMEAEWVMFVDVIMAKEVEQKVMDVLLVITWGGRTCSKELLETT